VGDHAEDPRRAERPRPARLLLRLGYLFTGATERAEKNRGVLAYQLAKGHLVGNHTFRHTNLQLAKESDAIAAIRDNDRALFDAAQVRPRLFRAPYRRLTDAVRRYLGDLGYVHADWNVDALDFQLSDPDEIKDAIMKQIRAREGGIVILHDNKPATAKAFPLILRALTDENCKRLRKGKEPIVPVELDYFATDADGNPLPVPEEVVARTAATRARIVARCTATSRK
jgi:peptidoglycan/xylan/chitin deacetylase (PgdA/CDA1 family)